MTQIIKTELYNSFLCIADKCRFSCCKGWKIAVDSGACHLWEGNSEISKFLCRDKSDAYVKMGEDKACPLLDDKDLCSLILTGREEYMTEICRTFPRLVNRYEDREEYSLSCACPEVVDQIYNLGKVGFIEEGTTVLKQSDATVLRDTMLALIQNSSYSLNERILLVFHMLLSIQDNPEAVGDIISIYCEEPYLKSLSESLAEMSVPLDATLSETNELLLDILQNFHTEKYYLNYLKEIYEAAEVFDAGKKFNQRQWKSFIKNYSSYEQLLADCITTKLFGEGVSDCIDDVLMSFQMIITEYIMVRYSAFKKSLKQEINYCDIRDFIVVYSRIIGYNQEGMREFWQDSFDIAIWELGYLLLLIGKEDMRRKGENDDQ